MRKYENRQQMDVICDLWWTVVVVRRGIISLAFPAKTTLFDL